MTTSATELNDEELQEFADEALNCLDSAEAAAEAPLARARFDLLFRQIHTVKGAAGMSGFPVIEALAHRLETVLDLRRAVPEEVDAALLREGAAFLRVQVISVRHRLAPPSLPHSLDARVEAAIRDQERSPLPVGQLLLQLGQVSSEQVAQARALQLAGDRRKIGEILVAIGATTEQEVAAAIHSQASASQLGRPAHERQDQDHLTVVLEQATEVRKAVQSLASELAHLASPEMVGRLEKLDSVADRLESLCRSMLHRAVERAWHRLGSFVEALALQRGKALHFMSSGGHLLIERGAIEPLASVLVHLGKNVVDHALESPQERVACGKPTVGVFRCDVSDEKTHLEVRVSDDGRGIDAVAVARRAVELGLVSESQLERLHLSERWELIFLPGISLSKQQSVTSGMGVGMDAVRNTVRSLGGEIAIETSSPRGTVFRIRLLRRVLH